MREERWTKAGLEADFGAFCLHSRNWEWRHCFRTRPWNLRPKVKPFWQTGVSTVGTEARSKVLAAGFDGRAIAVSAESFLCLNSKTDGRELAKSGNDVVFIYHNVIVDAVGDKRDTEHRTCAEVETAIEEIVKLLEKRRASDERQSLYRHG